MKPTFVWITENYRVNINAIFSLEKRGKDNSAAYNTWLQGYQNNLEYFSENPIEVWDDENETMIKYDANYDFSNNDQFENYDEFKVRYIVDNIMGPEPPLWTYEYWIILSTGIKMQIAQDKFEHINDIITKINEE